MVILEHSISNKDLRDNFLNTHNIPKDSSVVYLEGTKTTTRTPTADTDLHFRQESNFFYLTGCVEPDCAALFNLSTNEAVLLVPRYGDEYALWCGDYPTREDFAKKLEFTSVEYNEEQVITQLLKKWNAETVHCLEQYRDALYNIVGGSVKIDASKTLYFALKDARLIKNAREVDQIRKCCQIAAEAHVACMKIARPGINEYELEAELQRVVRSKGCKHLAYPAIIAGDDRGATLHYVNNDQVIHDGSLVLIDAGGEVPTLYASDITRVFPVNGKFTDDQKLIYNIVLNANKKVIERVKPGVEWAELHRYANRLMTEDMWKAGFLKADSLEELIDNHVGALFFPHGLGHSLGLDVHDPPNRDGSFTAYDQPGIKYLRTNAILKPGMVLTVEPGIYFIPRFLNSAFNNPSLSKYLVREKIEQFYKFGGVRIEDDLVVTENGSEVFTTGVPKEVDQIEQLMNN